MKNKSLDGADLSSLLLEVRSFVSTQQLPPTSRTAQDGQNGRRKWMGGPIWTSEVRLKN